MAGLFHGALSAHQGHGGGLSGITWSFVDMVTSTASTIVVPGTAAVQDYAFLIDIASGASPPASVTPTGFTLVDTISGSSRTRSTITYNRLAIGDLGSTITGINASTMGKILIIFRPSSNTSTITVSAVNTAGSTSVPANQTVIASGATKPPVVISAFGTNSTGTISAASMTPTEDGTGNGVAGSKLAKYKISNSSTPLDELVSMTASGGNDYVMQSFYFQAP